MWCRGAAQQSRGAAQQSRGAAQQSRGVPVRPLQLAPGRCSDQGRISRGQQLVVIIQPAGQLQQAAVAPIVVNQHACRRATHNYHHDNQQTITAVVVTLTITPSGSSS